MICAKTVRDCGLQADPKLSLGEDTKLIYECFLYEESIGMLDKCLYYLRQRMDGANITSVKNPILASQDKLKLICARKEIDEIGLERT